MHLVSTSIVYLVVPVKFVNNAWVFQLHDLKIFTKLEQGSKYVEILKEEGIESQLKHVEYNAIYSVRYALSFFGTTNYVVFPQKTDTKAKIKIFNNEHDAKKYKFSIKDELPEIITTFF